MDIHFLHVLASQPSVLCNTGLEATCYLYTSFLGDQDGLKARHAFVGRRRLPNISLREARFSSHKGSWAFSRSYGI